MAKNRKESFGRMTLLVGRSDLTELSTEALGSDVDILRNLKDRYDKDIIYTRVGTTSLLSVNPGRPLASNSARHQAYDLPALCSGETSPHAFEIAASAYLHMIRSLEDQAILTCGENGAGKTETLKLVLKHLLYLGDNGVDGPNADSRSNIFNAGYVLEAFGNAKTVHNKNSSRFSKYSEIQFNDDGNVVGVSNLCYMLEHSRTSQVGDDERNFHVFYQLVAGATSEEKTDFHLMDARNFAYLNHGKGSKVDGLNDAQNFQQLREILRDLGFTKKKQSDIFQLLAGILHLGNIEFAQDEHKKDDAAYIKNKDQLDLAASLLNVDAEQLEAVVTTRNMLVGDTMCTDFLDVKAANSARNALASALYSLLFSWIVEFINSQLVDSKATSIIGLLDITGFEDKHPKVNSFEQFSINYAHEKTRHFIFTQAFNTKADFYRSSGLPPFNVGDFDDSRLQFWENSHHGFLKLLDEQTSKPPDSRRDAMVLDDVDVNRFGNQVFTKGLNGWSSFHIQHYSNNTAYSVDGFVEKNRSYTWTASALGLFGITGDPSVDQKKKIKPFITTMLLDSKIETVQHPKSKGTIVAARQADTPRKVTLRTANDNPGGLSRVRSLRKTVTISSVDSESSTRSATDEKHTLPSICMRQKRSLQQLFQSLELIRTWNILCIKPWPSISAGSHTSFMESKVSAQIVHLRLGDLAKTSVYDYTAGYTFAEFISRYLAREPKSEDEKLQIDGFLTKAFSTPQDFVISDAMVYLSEHLWRELESDVDQQAVPNDRRIHVTRIERSETSQQPCDFGPLINTRRKSNKVAIDIEGPEPPLSENKSDLKVGRKLTVKEAQEEVKRQESSRSCCGCGRGKGTRPKFKPDKMLPKAPAPPMTSQRRSWVRFTWAVTWWIPETLLIKWGKMHRDDVRMAWREKVALCIIDLLLSGLLLFFVQGFGVLLCPNESLFSPEEVAKHTRYEWNRKDIWMSMNGYVYDVSQFVDRHPNGSITDLAGMDVSAWFPRLNGVSGEFPQDCIATFRPGLDIDKTTHDSCKGKSRGNTGGFCHNTDEVQRRIDDYGDIYIWKVGQLAYPYDAVLQHKNYTSDAWIILKGKFYNVTLLTKPTGGDSLKSKFEDVIDDIKYYVGMDASRIYKKFEPYIKCMDALFYVGAVDTRAGPGACQASEYILLATTGILVLVLVVKFLAALQLGSRAEPENHDRFVLLQVPCYTEGEDSLRKTIDSLALLDYDDTRKLLFLIADGMIKGAGNDLPTPEIVLKILGVDPAVQPQAKSYVAIGEGSKQHNKAKVYSGLYSIQGRYVPYLVVVKVGKENETSRPGNRGKRDSQMILMKFLNKVHFNSPMTPLDLEMYHHIKNIIGVDPYLYEYCLMVDADTEVVRDSLNRLISFMVHDTKIMGLCGETRIANEKDSWVTMMQVYEYYISHHMAKAFESLFGSVTCLPGCFCMYRIRTPEKKVPLLIHPDVIRDYEENNVDTLHKKNLLSLGEDRYLTTLMLKYFPEYRNKFTSDSICLTIVPDKFSILLSQRRRWINSTIHNLFELMFLPQLCGCLCFSMRLVVFLDFFATLTMPASIAYLVYLIIQAAYRAEAPTLSLIMLGIAYGLQTIIFILKREWQHIGWMIISILALPVFGFYLPLYAFWHFDDFSWGNTRRIAGASGRDGGHGGDEEKFDPSTIPLQTWDAYEKNIHDQPVLSPVGTLGSQKGSLRSDDSGKSSRSSKMIFGSQYALPGTLLSEVGAYGKGGYSRPNEPEIVQPYSAYNHPTNGAYLTPTYGSAMSLNQTSVHARSPRFPGFPSNDRALGRSESDMDLDRYIQSKARHSGATVQTRNLNVTPSGIKSPTNPELERGFEGEDNMSTYSKSGSEVWKDGSPTNDEILDRIRLILSKMPLEALTKKKVRELLSAYFKSDLSDRREFINDSIELVLQGAL
ncbi:hypothetical protein HK102_010987 [Quaeritorhiza haematococci]|nr:hypothetical protein HK102_010987 [Quaeritorhiza haematococci]